MKIFVGLSGGVDSAVSAALLKDAGYDVTGVFIKIWQPEFIECTWREDRLDAMRVAAHLAIPFREVDLSAEYERSVVRSMISDYERGITPNPDVLCNEKIKFGAFAKWATDEGAEKIATGHYARIDSDALLRGVDRSKDQSYFLHRITEEQLTCTLFPVGGLQKKDVRREAERFGLPNASRPDSQGLCFIGDVSMADFLARFIPLQKGTVIDGNGSAVGEHNGAALYTIGQRHGFMHSGAKPMYVTAINTEANTITVSQDKHDASRTSVRLRDVHRIHGDKALPEKVRAQLRYRENPVSASIKQAGSGIDLIFDMPQIASYGQSAVLYEGDRCLGGGIIDRFSTASA